jgi:hypothetical protein
MYKDIMPLKSSKLPKLPCKIIDQKKITKDLMKQI